MSLINCVNVYVKESDIINAGIGAFAAKNIKKDEVTELGIVRLVDLDGHKNPYVFTWDPINKKKWALGSGCSTFYNTSNHPNTKMIRDYDNLSFKIIALRDIEKNEELTHKYLSINWRNCFLKQKL